MAIEHKDRYPEISDSDFDVTKLVEANVGISSLYKGGDACLRQHTIDIDSCKTQALVGAAVCGLSSATIVGAMACGAVVRSEEHTSELQSRGQLVCRLRLAKSI